MPKGNDESGNDARLSRGSSPAENRQPRSEESRAVTDDRTSKEARMNMFRNELFQSAMPKLPPIDGYHVCWLTTTNPRDSIANRMQLGYEPIKASEVPGFDAVTVKTGDYAGCIGVNEMLAFKIPLELYEMYMMHNHHDAPNSEEDKLKAAIEEGTQLAKGVKSKVIAEEGQAELGRTPRAPSFEVIS